MSRSATTALAATSGADDDALLALVATIEALSAARTVEDVAEAIRSSARRITGADGVAIVLRDNGQCYYVDEDAIGPLWKGKRFPMTACVSGWAMLNRQTVVIPDIYKDDRVPHDVYRPTFVRSMVMTPVRAEDPVAAIGAYWAAAREPTAGELRKLEVMARAAAAAIEAAQLRASLEAALAAKQALVNELDHRVKNTLAASLSIASQTLRSTPSPDEFNTAFQSRVFSLASAHELLSNADWCAVPIESVVQAALAPFGGAGARGEDRRIVASGPPMMVKAEPAVALHMALHELGMNAAAHGALGAPQGRVSLVWSLAYAVVEGRQRPARMELTWRESGGPAIAPPARRGFGAKLIEQGLPRELGGQGQLSFEPTGLRFCLTAPLSHRLTPA